MTRLSIWLSIVVVGALIVWALATGHLNGRFLVALPLIPFSVYMVEAKNAALDRRLAKRRPPE